MIQQDGPSTPDGGMLRRACAENITGFERAYTVTFYASCLALLLGLLLPGWPGKWAGRRDAETPAVSH